MDRRKIILKQVAKYFILSLSVFVLYIIQSTPGFLRIFGIKPVFVIPFCITLSMFDDSHWAVVVYLVGGLLTDMSCGRIVGFYTIQLLFACLVGLVAVKFFFKANVRNSVLFSFAAMTVMMSVDFFFYIILPGVYTGKRIYYLKTVLLTGAFSALFSARFYHYINFINQRFLRYDAR